MDKSITVAVGTPDNLRSSIWRLWVQGDEVYFGATHLMPALKVSLHKTGKWHIAWSDDAMNPISHNRYVCKWRRPQANLQGFVAGVSVIVDPFISKRPFLNKTITTPGVTWLPVALHGKILALNVVFAPKKVDLDSSRMSPTDQVVARIPKSNGENVLFIASNFTPPAWVWTSIAKWRSEVKINIKETELNEARFSDGTRICSISLPNPPLHPTPAIYDLSLGWENVSSNAD